MDAIEGDAGVASRQDRFQHLARVIASERFLKLQGLGNEAPFFICPYPADEAGAMEQAVRQLVESNANFALALYKTIAGEQRGIRFTA